ncbi:MAG: ABC transporter permease [Acidobacteria bacterium]|nr:ABC transporter permease [Acidobacteriota bacterium]MBI3424973.1 ABC transporter permease [Acidobacteriota bacterium]
MDKIFAVIKREYLTRVTSRGFMIWTILTPLLGALLMFAPGYFMERTAQRGKVVVLDQTGDAALFPLAQELFYRGPVSTRYELAHETVTPGTVTDTRMRELSQQLSTGQVAGFLIVPPEVFSRQGTLSFHTATQNLREQSLTMRLRIAFNSAVIERRWVKEGINVKRADELMEPVELTVVSERDQGKGSEAFILALGMLVVLYGIIIIYGQLVLRGVVEEKQSRIIEVLLSSIKPFHLMLGKLIGIGLVSLTQVAVWIVAALLLSMAAATSSLTSSSFHMPPLPPMLVIFFFVYFVLGYFLFSTLFLIVGAMVSAEEDAQQLQMPVVLSVVAPMLLLEQVLRQPNSLFATVVSMVPLFSPILMFGRIAVEPPPWWQIGLSIVLLLLSIWGAVWLAAKIYRVGVLMYGKPPTLPELFKWLKYS